MLKRRTGVRSLLVSLSLILSALPAWFATPAQAHHRHHHHSYARASHSGRVASHGHRRFAHSRHARFAWQPSHWAPEHEAQSNFAAIVVDGNSGQVLYARDENEPRHPASITKVMTLYLLFEQLESGRLHLDSRIPISAHAAAQAPTKLGLRPGSTISVDDAIKAIVTLSANDIAVAVAEAIGGDEETFAAMMTRKAHALGMLGTHYANASGLPNEEQITTAADLALLGRAIQERFPRYYHYFSTQVFVYRGIANRNHNHLLGRIEGLDGIKTGYTRASGFNLLTSVKRQGHFIVAVVLGGATSSGRDRIMANLIETEIGKSSTERSAPVIAEVAAEKIEERREPAKLVEAARESLGAVSRADPFPVASIPPTPRPRPAFVSSTPLDQAQRGAGIGTRRVAFDGSTERPTTSTTTPSMLRWTVGPSAAASPQNATTIVMRSEARVAQPQSSDVTSDSETADQPRPAGLRTGWMIQIGATDDADAASKLLARARARKLATLGDAQPFTQKVQKGAETLYRARFAGLDADDAEAACKSLRRTGFACFATKN